MLIDRFQSILQWEKKQQGVRFNTSPSFFTLSLPPSISLLSRVPLPDHMERLANQLRREKSRTHHLPRNRPPRHYSHHRQTSPVAGIEQQLPALRKHLLGAQVVSLLYESLLRMTLFTLVLFTSHAVTGLVQIRTLLPLILFFHLHHREAQKLSERRVWWWW